MLKVTIVTELEFPEVTEKYKMTVLEKWNWGDWALLLPILGALVMPFPDFPVPTE